MGVQLKSNEDLYRFLLSLSEEFQRQGNLDVADKIVRVSRFAIGSPSEFLHESGQLLRSLREEFDHKLTPSQREDIADVIKKIDDAFRKVGGA